MYYLFAGFEGLVIYGYVLLKIFAHISAMTHCMLELMIGCTGSQYVTVLSVRSVRMFCTHNLRRKLTGSNNNTCSTDRTSIVWAVSSTASIINGPVAQSLTYPDGLIRFGVRFNMTEVINLNA